MQMVQGLGKAAEKGAAEKEAVPRFDRPFVAMRCAKFKPLGADFELFLDVFRGRGSLGSLGIHG